jgi:N-acetylneuraminate synthase
MKQEIIISGKKIGKGHPCYIIAEAGVNHNGQLDLAFKLVDIAKDAGANAIKFQLYRVSEQVSKYAMTADYQLTATKAKTMIEMAKSYDLPWEEHRKIINYCKEKGIDYLASCFDQKAVDFYLSIGGESFKVGSGEITNYPLLGYMASKEKPILLSTGMSSLMDVAGAVEWIQNNGNTELALFHCTSNYPAEPKSINLKSINTLKEAFHLPVGYSDHTIGDEIPVAAIAIGANLLEKHFTIDKNLPGPDHSMSMNPEELTILIKKVRSVELAMGDGEKKPFPSEIPVRNVARRSLVSMTEIIKGEVLNDQNVTLKRPGTGIDPRLWQFIKGREAKTTIPMDVTITWDMIK